ncbi:hypothetical protein SETIT_8G092900v2 [Setaria italica]|uniref:Uncharacterized protein n=1 Tax=Setaria italica TaxID=4555 RepID=A0A368S5Y2_SETIT|nr:hypothetical protein SETIT_8G092900v2 [Setaria italica]
MDGFSYILFPVTSRYLQFKVIPTVDHSVHPNFAESMGWGRCRRCRSGGGAGSQVGGGAGVGVAGRRRVNGEEAGMEWRRWHRYGRGGVAAVEERWRSGGGTDGRVGGSVGVGREASGIGVEAALVWWRRRRCRSRRGGAGDGCDGGARATGVIAAMRSTGECGVREGAGGATRRRQVAWRRGGGGGSGEEGGDNRG